MGSPVNIYETELEGCTAFVITLEDEEKNRVASQVAQPDSKVGQPRLQNAADSRLAALESKTDTILQFIQANSSASHSISKKGAPESGFEPESEPRQGSMIGRYTTRACARKATA